MKTFYKSSPRIRGTSPEIERAARQLRLNPTPAEQILWAHLRNKQLNGWKFRRQHPLGQFIADFCCPACKLIVEVDGPIHVRQGDRDESRTQVFAAYGYRVMRFSNEQVANDLDFVLAKIAEACQTES
jgi:very-short-patch-repair endonuclease